jgi:nucleoside-diphosphate-sugar epimerase
LSVLLTGITGFIGSNLAAKLVEDGYDVYGLVRHVSRSELRSLEPLLDKIRFVEGDITEYHSVRSTLRSISPEAVIHLAALTPVRHSFEDPFPYVRANYEGTMNFAHAVLETSPQTRMIAASTAEVYGWQPNSPTLEDSRLSPASPYAVSKAACDNYLQMAMKVYGLKATVLRCNNSYGRAGEKGYIVEYLITTMLASQTAYVGAPSHIRDYMYVADHVEAYRTTLKREDAAGEVFNVSPGNPISNIELAKKIAKIVGFKGEIVDGSYPPGYPMRPADWDTEYIVLDSSKIRRVLGWNPSVTLDEGLRKTVEQWRNTTNRTRPS